MPGLLSSRLSPWMFASAWSPPSPTTSSPHHITHRHQYQSQRRPGMMGEESLFMKTQLSATSKSSTTSEPLSSAYDRNIPAAIVGEAVRAALRSDRGICFDFTTDRYNGADAVSSGTGSSRLVSVVKMHGDGTNPFINAKFSQSIPNSRNGVGGGGGLVQLSPKTELVRKGHAIETAYLSSKGRIIDKLLVLAFPLDNDNSEDVMGDAFLITSPGNSGATLYNELSPLVFPMDKVTLTECSQQTNVITLACSSLENSQLSFNNNVKKLLMNDESYSGEFEFPKDGVCHHYRVYGDSESATDVYLMQHTFLSTDICHGYTLLFKGGANSSGQTLAAQIWDNLTGEYNDKGPVGLGSQEYDVLRVEAGLPAYGSEMTGDGPKNKAKHHHAAEKLGEPEDERADDAYYAKSSPLELHLQHLIDTEKGCYQGQEGVASMLKNKRGCPRQLYQAVFYDSDNDFDGDGGFGLLSIDNQDLMDFQRLKKRAGPLSNDTRQPRPGDDIYVLGSDESIQVGKITSVAEPNGTGDAKTVALALARRPGSILKAIKDQGLELPRWWEDAEDRDEEEDGGNGNNIAKSIASEKGGSGIMQPPPLDPLHNLEVVIGGTYTVGRLLSVPSRRYHTSRIGNVATLMDYEGRGAVVDAKDGPGYFRYDFQGDEEVPESVAQNSANIPMVESDSPPLAEGETIGDDDEDQMDELLAKAEEEATKAAAEAEAAAAEAKRKEEKMKMLKAKAEAAMAARRKKKTSN